ncbi:MAG: succinate dehydrogenase assembly factor 2 [Pelomonas sp.]|nr:succinate dehydrogenase assembly factor 2 [Roseateles sp.]
METLIDERELSRLRWRCRRGLLENDLFIERFFERYENLSEVQADGLTRLMDLSDNDLLDLLLARKQPAAEIDSDSVRLVLSQLRTPQQTK